MILSIDTNIQKIAEEALGRRQGSVIVLKPATGEVLAMVTYPYYDSRVFMSDNAGKAYLDLLNDPQKPMLDRAYQSSYPPASTFKTILTASILEENFIPPDKTIYCPGEISYGGRSWSCWIKRPGHGSLALEDAHAQSSDIYMDCRPKYVGVENIVTIPGFGKEKTPELICREKWRLLPTPSWKEEKYNDRDPGDTMNLPSVRATCMYLRASPNMMDMIVKGSEL